MSTNDIMAKIIKGLHLLNLKEGKRLLDIIKKTNKQMEQNWEQKKAIKVSIWKQYKA